MKRVLLFPLPNTVFFPGIRLPLHVFEPRYREMTEDAIQGHQHIAVVLLRPGWDADYEGTPAVFEVATIGVIEEYEKLSDGRYNMILKGVERVKLLELPDGQTNDLAPGKRYRVRWARAIPEISPPDGSEAEKEARLTLLQLWKQLIEEAGVQNQHAFALTGYAPLYEFVNEIASRVELPSEFKQRLLEEDELVRRARALVSALEEQILQWSTLRRFRNLVPQDPRLN